MESEVTPDPKWAWAPVSDSFHWSPELAEIIGRERGAFDVGARSFIERLHPEDREGVEASLRQQLGGMEPLNIQCRLRHEDGRHVHVALQGEKASASDAGSTRVSGRAFDIDAVVTQAGERLFAKIAETLPGAIYRYIQHADGREEVEFLNPGCHMLVGLEKDGTKLDRAKLRELVFAEDLAAITAANEAAAKNLMPWSCRWRFRYPDGEVRWVYGAGTPMRLDDGATLCNIMVVDITDQVQMEQDLARSQELLHQAQKLEAIGKLTGGVSHDFNNLLSVILGNLELLRQDPDSAKRDGFIDDALKATSRGRDLVRSLLSFARRAPLTPVDLDLNDAIQGLDSLLRRTLPASIALETSLMAGLWTTKLDMNSFENALLNLVVNARDAMPKGGRLTIETANVRRDADDVRLREEEIGPGRYVMVWVRDTGTGIAPEILPAVFEPFFSTKPPSHGAGLGLSMVQGFAKQSGGSVRICSEITVGTTVKMFFKAVTTPAEPRATSQPDGPGVPAGKARILLVEDDPSVRRVLTAHLGLAGYDVVAAPNAAAAIEAFGTNGPIDLVLTDVVMPGRLQGPALAGQLREMQPDLKVIFLSGYPSDAVAHGNGPHPNDAWLTKPVLRADLLGTIAKVLAR